MSSYLLGLAFVVIFVVYGSSEHDLLVCSVIMLAAGDIRREIEARS